MTNTIRWVHADPPPSRCDLCHRKAGWIYAFPNNTNPTEVRFACSDHEPQLDNDDWDPGDVLVCRIDERETSEEVTPELKILIDKHVQQQSAIDPSIYPPWIPPEHDPSDW